MVLNNVGVVQWRSQRSVERKNALLPDRVVLLMALLASSDDEETASGNPAKGVSPEESIFREVQKVVNSSYAAAADGILLRGGRTAASLQGHVESLFMGNTDENTRMKLGDWVLYCKVMYKGSIPEFQDVQWPPSAGCWLHFLLEARVLVSSYKRFQGVVGNVCEVADCFWSKKQGVCKEQVDPRQLYSAEHVRAMHTIKRQHGMGVKQVAAVTMDEARNATHFGDADSVRGVAMCAAFTIGTLMGGRRPRTLTAIRLRDLKLFAGCVMIDGIAVCVPCVSITFREEKYDDIQGPREATDVPHSEGYGEMRFSSCQVNTPSQAAPQLLTCTSPRGLFACTLHPSASNRCPMMVAGLAHMTIAGPPVWKSSPRLPSRWKLFSQGITSVQTNISLRY